MRKAFLIFMLSLIIISCVSEEAKIKQEIIKSKSNYKIEFLGIKIQNNKAIVQTKENCFIKYPNGGWRYWIDVPVTYELEKINGDWLIKKVLEGRQTSRSYFSSQT